MNVDDVADIHIILIYGGDACFLHVIIYLPRYLEHLLYKYLFYMHTSTAESYMMLSIDSPGIHPSSMFVFLNVVGFWISSA